MQISRRTFIAGLAAGGLAAAMLSEASAAEASQPSPSMTLGFSTYGMKTLGATEAVQAVAKIGFDAIEIACVPDFPTDIGALSPAAAKELQKAVADSGLRLSALMDNLPLHVDDSVFARQLSRLERLCELANELAPKNPPVVETVLGGAPDKFKDLRQRFLERLAAYEKIAAKLNVTLAIKPHRMNAVSSPAQAIALIEQAAPKSRHLRLVYDWSHYALRPDLVVAGDAYTIEKSVTEALPYTVFVAAKDVEVSNGKAQFKLPGTTPGAANVSGAADQVQVIKALHAGGYKGDVNCEVSSAVWRTAGYDPLIAARDCYKAMAEAFKQAGVARGRR